MGGTTDIRKDLTGFECLNGKNTHVRHFSQDTGPHTVLNISYWTNSPQQFQGLEKLMWATVNVITHETGCVLNRKTKYEKQTEKTESVWLIPFAA